MSDERRRWWESPKLLGFTALGIVAVLTIIFIGNAPFLTAVLA